MSDALKRTLQWLLLSLAAFSAAAAPAKHAVNERSAEARDVQVLLQARSTSVDLNGTASLIVPEAPAEAHRAAIVAGLAAFDRQFADPGETGPFAVPSSGGRHHGRRAVGSHALPPARDRAGPCPNRAAGSAGRHRHPASCRGTGHRTWLHRRVPRTYSFPARRFYEEIVIG